MQQKWELGTTSRSFNLGYYLKSNTPENSYKIKTNLEFSFRDK